LGEKWDLGILTDPVDFLVVVKGRSFLSGEDMEIQGIWQVHGHIDLLCMDSYYLLVFLELPGQLHLMLIIAVVMSSLSPSFLVCLDRTLATHHIPLVCTCLLTCLAVVLEHLMNTLIRLLLSHLH